MTRQVLLVATWLLALAPAALAHSFNVVMVVPADLEQGVRDDITTALLVASEERDSHANEESDGHLGGLDVYFTLAGPNQSDRIAAADPDILILTLREELQSDDAIKLTPLPASTPKAAAFLARPAAPDLAPFGERFAARTGSAPGSEATTAYIAARQIDLAVRAIGGVDDRAALERLLSGD